MIYFYEFYSPVPPQQAINENQNVNQNQNTNQNQTVTENMGNAEDKKDLIVLVSPQPNGVVTSPLELNGEARGNWYFEAVFPVKLYDANGNVLVQGQGQAQGEWTTTDFVPFKTTLEFTVPATDTGTLVLEKDDPSGLPANADSLIVPVKFR